MNSSGRRIRRRSGCPSNRIPNISHTSRSSQFAPSHKLTTDGTTGSGSLRNDRTVIRSFVRVLANR